MATSTNDPNASNKSWELSLYELNRQPQPVITDCTEIAVSPRSLHSELMCPICLDMLKTTMTTKECLHRFCQDCIITALRSGNKECPTCRKKLVSKRSLRPDPNFDALISKIYPSREDYDAQQERVMAKVSKHNFSANIEETLKMQAMNRSRHGKKVAGEASEEATTSAAAAAAASASASASASAAATSTASASRHPSTSSSRNGGEGSSAAATGDPLSEGEGEEEEDEDEDDNDSGWGEEQADSSGLESAGPQANDVELVVKPLPHGERTNPYLKTVRYIKTTVTATVDHISKYLEMRYTMENRDSGGASSNGSSSASASSEQELPGASQLDGSTGGPALPSTSTSSSSSGDIQTVAAAAVASTSSSSAVSAAEAGSDYGSASSSAGLEATSSTSCSATTKKYPFAIFIAAGPGQFHPLSGDWSLTAVVDKYWKVNRPLELFYAYKVASLTAKQAADHPVGASARW